MPRIAAPVLALALGLAAALALASCGSSTAKLLPGTTAAQINENLRSVRELAGEGECISAQDEAQRVSTQIGDLQGIDPKLKEALTKGAERLSEVVLTCTEETTEETTEESLPSTTETTPGRSAKEKKPKKEAPAPAGAEETEAPEPAEETPPTTTPKGEAKGQEEAGEGAQPPPPSGGIGPGSAAAGGN